MEQIYGIDRAAKHAGSIGHLAWLLGVTERRLMKWRREDPAAALQKVIKQAGTQAALAGLLDVAQTTVSKWVCADCPVPVKPEPRNGIERAVQIAGSQSALARRLGVRQPSVTQWVKQGYAPAARAKEIEMEFGVPRVDCMSPEMRDVMGTGGEL